MQEVQIPSVHLRLQLDRDQPQSTLRSVRHSDTVSFEMTADKFRVLFAELAAARELMEALE